MNIGILKEAKMKPINNRNIKESCYIIIRGPLGIGKSTIAREIADRLDAEYFSIDGLLEEKELDKVEGKCIPLSNFLKINEMIVSKVRKKLKEGKVVIFDGNFYHKEQIDNLTGALKFRHYVFTLKAPIKTCIIRDAQRKRVYGEEAAKAVHNLVSKFNYGINIETDNKSSKEVVKLILKKIKGI